MRRLAIEARSTAGDNRADAGESASVEFRQNEFVLGGMIDAVLTTTFPMEAEDNKLGLQRLETLRVPLFTSATCLPTIIMSESLAA